MTEAFWWDVFVLGLNTHLGDIVMQVAYFVPRGCFYWLFEVSYFKIGFSFKTSMFYMM